MDIVKLTYDNLVRSVENALRFSKPLLIENVPEEFNPILHPVLQKQIYKQNGADVIELGDTVFSIPLGLQAACYYPAAKSALLTRTFGEGELARLHMHTSRCSGPASGTHCRQGEARLGKRTCHLEMISM